MPKRVRHPPRFFANTLACWLLLSLCLGACSNDDDDLAGAVCGDGEVGDVEVCDSNTEPCESGCYAGQRACRADCSGWGDCEPLERCGDGTAQSCEVCDGEERTCGVLGGYAGTQTCNEDCSGWGECRSEEFCGDGIIQAVEDCDDGDRCGEIMRCRCDCAGVLPTICGDGLRAGSEECDDGNLIDGDGCGSNCVLDYCGDGDKSDSEVCDDGPHCGNAGQCACDSSGIVHDACGDGVLDAGEGCDSDEEIPCATEEGHLGSKRYAGNCSGYGPCRSDAFCSDGVLNGFEDCDDGNLTDGDGCNALCRREFCGNGYAEPGEACDDGASCGEDYGCACDCSGEIQPLCGNGTTDFGEACDTTERSCMDANGYAGTEKCAADCLGYERCEGFRFCGDGVINGEERCDDGNRRDGDGCNSLCDIEVCGNGYVEPPEECDDPNPASRFCENDCRLKPIIVLPEGIYEIGSDVLANYYGLDQPSMFAFKERPYFTAALSIETAIREAAAWPEAQQRCQAIGMRIPTEEEWQIFYELPGSDFFFPADPKAGDEFRAEWTSSAYVGLDAYRVVKNFRRPNLEVDVGAYRQFAREDQRFRYRCVR